MSEVQPEEVLPNAPKSVIKKIKLWQYCAASFILLGSVYTSAAAIGLDMPRWAWLSEVQAAEMKINSMKLNMERRHAGALRRAWRGAVSRMAEMQAKNIPVPLELKKDEEELREEYQAQKKYVRELEKKR